MTDAFWQLHLLCCWPDSTIHLLAFLAHHKIRNLAFAILNPIQNNVSCSMKDGIHAALPQAQRLMFCLSPYDTLHVASHSNPEFYADRTHAAGGVCEQTKTALQKILRDMQFCKHLCITQHLSACGFCTHASFKAYININIML